MTDVEEAIAAIRRLDEFMPSLTTRKLVPTSEVVDFCLDLRILLDRVANN